MTSYEAKLESNGNKASHCFRPLSLGNVKKKCLLNFTVGLNQIYFS